MSTTGLFEVGFNHALRILYIASFFRNKQKDLRLEDLFVVINTWLPLVDVFRNDSPTFHSDEIKI